MVSGVFLPICTNCTSSAVEQGLGLVGAVIMPHNIYLHSGLVLVELRRIERVGEREGGGKDGGNIDKHEGVCVH